MHHIPGTRHQAHTQVSLAKAPLHARTLLQLLIEFIDAMGVDQIEIERAQLGTVGKLVFEHHVQCALVPRARARRNLFPCCCSLVALDQPRQRAKSGLEIEVLNLAAFCALGIEVLPRHRRQISPSLLPIAGHLKISHRRSSGLSSASRALGAYFKTQMTKAREERRIGKVPVDRSRPVNTFWDIGKSDNTAIWFHQNKGQMHHLVDYYENNGEGVEHCGFVPPAAQ
jgi:hypothetical protein